MKFDIRHAHCRLRFEHDVPCQKAHVHKWRVFYGRRVKAITTCTIETTLRDGWRDGWKVIAEGMAACSLEDQYVKETGRKIALTRAIARWPRDDRKMVWAAYWKAKGIE